MNIILKQQDYYHDSSFFHKIEVSEISEMKQESKQEQKLKAM